MKSYFFYSIDEVEVDGEVLKEKSEKIEFDDLNEAIKFLVDSKDLSDVNIIGVNIIGKRGWKSVDIIKMRSVDDIRIRPIKDLPKSKKLEKLVDYFS